MTVVDSSVDFRSRSFTGWLAGRRARSVLLAIGLLLIYILSSFTIDIPGRAPVQRDWVFGRLNRDHTFGQTFIATPGELVAVRLMLLAGPGGRGDTVELRLHAAEGGLPDLAIVSVPMNALAQRDWTTFEIPPLTISQTTTLRLDLAAPTLTPSDWVTVIAGPDTYPAGELFADDKPYPRADLAFEPVYRQRWLDWLLPISRMAHGKPGVLGWPPLYGLLAYCFCLALVLALAKLWSVARHR